MANITIVIIASATLALGALTACGDAQAQKELDGLGARLAPLRARILKIRDALPTAGQEVAASCTTPLAGPIYPFDEAALRADAGAAERPPATIAWRNFSALDLPSDARLRESDALGARVGFLKKRVPIAEGVQRVLVLRTSAEQPGKTTAANGKHQATILEPASWSGWAFVVGVDGELLAAWPVAARSGDVVEGITSAQHPEHVLAENVAYKVRTAVAREAQERCGLEAKFAPESPF
jgi:hypothetical protein